MAMLRVFVSSTSVDLRAHREAVGSAISKLGHHPVVMEDFTATDASATEKCRREVEGCDVFIGIYAYRYGFIPPNETESITELEYDWATAAKIPRLAFVVDPAYEWPAEFRDSDPVPLDAFKRRIDLERVRATFTTPESLTNGVTASLANLIQQVRIEPRERQRQRRQLTTLLAAIAAVVVIAAVVTVVLNQQESQRQTDRIATNQAVALLNQTATAAQWTKTPTNTPTRTPTPTFTPTNTPLAGPTAITQGQNREVLVLLTDFKLINVHVLAGTPGPQEEWIYTLNTAIRQLKGKVNARVLQIHETIDSPDPAQGHEAARRLSDVYDATLVIWGRVRGMVIETFYTISPRGPRSTLDVNLGDTSVSFAELRELSSFISRGGDTEYVLNLVLAQLAYFGDDPRAALPFLDRCIALIPKGREAQLGAEAAYFYRAYLYAGFEKNHDEALADLTKAIALNPDLAEPYNNRGVVFQNLKRYAEALADYTSAITLNPDLATAFNNRGTVYVELKRYAEALADLTKAIALNPEYADAYYNRGVVYDHLKRYAEALADLTKAIALNPNSAMYYNTRGTVYIFLKRYAEALADYTRAIALDSDYATAYTNRGAVYAFLERFEEALADFKTVVKLVPEGPDGYLALGLVYDILDMPLEALQAFRRYLELAGPDADPQVSGIIRELEATLTPAPKQPTPTYESFDTVTVTPTP